MDEKSKKHYLWGAKAIGDYINEANIRTVYHRLEKGQIPARKVGETWVSEAGELEEALSAR